MREYEHNELLQWAVIGAGPAGIAAVGKLLDAGVPADRLAWIDPAFAVGDFGTMWRNVSSNTRVGLFLDFLNGCDAFAWNQCEEHFPLHGMDTMQGCELHSMADALQWVTRRLRERVRCFAGVANAVDGRDGAWRIALPDIEVRATRVVLAIGSQPKTLALSDCVEIPIVDAMDARRLLTHCCEDDIVAIFGSSHSAILIIRSLLETCRVKRVVNFYEQPLCFAEHMSDWIRFDDTGLKGSTAEWARANIQDNCPANLQRVPSTAQNIALQLPACGKVIYAIGFTPRTIMVNGESQVKHNPMTGVIAPGLFGVGIAFPQAKVNRDGLLEHRVGLWKFMQYLNDVLPLWMV